MFIYLCTHNTWPRAWYRWGYRKGLIPTPEVNDPGRPCCSHACRPAVKHRTDRGGLPCVGVIGLPEAPTRHTRRCDKPCLPLPVLIPEGPLRASSFNSGRN